MSGTVSLKALIGFVFINNQYAILLMNQIHEIEMFWNNIPQNWMKVGETILLIII